MNREEILPHANVEVRSEPRGVGNARPSHPSPEGEQIVPSASTDRFVKSETKSVPQAADEKRMAPLFLGTGQGSSTRKNGKRNPEDPPRSPAVLDGFSIEGFGRLAGGILIGLSILYLAAKALPTLSAPSWWRAGDEESRMIRLCQEAKETLGVARSLDQELAERTPLAPIVAAVAFSVVPSLLVDEMEVVAPLPTHAGRVLIKIRSFDSEGMAALATFGAMVSMSFDRSTGRKIRLDPTDVRIPYSLDGGDTHGGEPIRALLIAPLRWEDLR